MRFLFYIHGTPKGQNIWGAEEDRDYIKSCYTSETEEKVRFIIEVSPRTNRTYFSYLRYKDFLSADNRPGAYFGMTLSIDGLYYCKDTANLYKLFDQIYTKCVANGTIVEKRQDKEAYKVSSFAEKTAKLEEIQKLLLETFTKSFVDKGDICRIDSNHLAKTSSALQRYNLSDVDCPAFYDGLCNSLKVYVSPEYPSKDNLIQHLNQQINPEKEKSKRMAEECSKLQEQLSNTIRERDSLKQKVGVLDTTKQQLEGTLRDKERRISDLEQRNRLLEKERTKQQVETTIRQIHPQIKELSQQMSRIVPDRQYDEEYQQKQKCTPQSIGVWATLGISALCLLILAFIVVFLLCPHLFTKQNTPDKVEVHKAVVTSTLASPTTAQEIIVNFENNRGDCIYQDSTYYVYVENVPVGSRSEWKMDGFDIVSGERISQQVRVRANKGTEKAVLSLYVDGNKEWSQEYKVQK